MARKLVGITCSTSAANVDLDSNDTARQFLNTAYARAVQQAGGVPVVIPNLPNEELAGRYLESIDGLLLSGGVDVAPTYYGEAPHAKLGDVDDARDATELALLRRALAADIPIFGICRGIQVINVALGGTLYQHLPDQAPSAIHHRQSDIKIPRSQFSHQINVDADSRLRSIVGVEEMQTNSFHHQAIHAVAPGLMVTAHAADGIVEAVEAPEYRYLVAVQFHPEETAPADRLSRRLFEAFIEAL